MIGQQKRKQVLQKTGGICAHCGAVLTAATFTVEHVIPKSFGGTNEMQNLVPLCLACNRARGNSAIDVEKFYKYLNKGIVAKLNRYIKGRGYLKMISASSDDIFGVGVGGVEFDSASVASSDDIFVDEVEFVSDSVANLNSSIAGKLVCRCAHCGVDFKKAGVPCVKHPLLPILVSEHLKVGLCQFCSDKYRGKVVLNLSVEFPYLKKEYALLLLSAMEIKLAEYFGVKEF